MTDVFISYAREDSAQAERIARGLEAAGLSAFWDNEIPPGQTWADYIETKLNQCAVAVVLWSEHSTKSQWVREEARMGQTSCAVAHDGMKRSDCPLREEASQCEQNPRLDPEHGPAQQIERWSRAVEWHKVQPAGRR